MRKNVAQKATHQQQQRQRRRRHAICITCTESGTQNDHKQLNHLEQRHTKANGRMNENSRPKRATEQERKKIIIYFNQN